MLSGGCGDCSSGGYISDSGGCNITMDGGCSMYTVCSYLYVSLQTLQQQKVLQHLPQQQQLLSAQVKCLCALRSPGRQVSSFSVAQLFLDLQGLSLFVGSANCDKFPQAFRKRKSRCLLHAFACSVSALSVREFSMPLR